MKRREFLFSAAAAAGVAGLPTAWAAQTAQSAPPPSGGAKPQLGRIKQSTLDRIAIMTLNFQRMLKVPDTQDSPERTLELFDIGEMLADTYGVHKVEFQHYHLASTETSYLKALRAKLEKAKSRATQINLEFSGLNICAPQNRDRVLAVDLTKAFIDHAVTLGAQRVMINQGAPTQENKANGIAALKLMSDYGKSKNIIVSVETRGGGRRGAVGTGQGQGQGQGTAAGAPAAGAPTAAAPTAPASSSTGGPQTGAPQGPPPVIGKEAWMLLAEIIKGAGAYSNVDVGGAGALDQEELHLCLKTMFPMTANTMHTRVNTRWDLATAMKYLEGELGYKGLYTIEASNGHEGTQQIYDVIVATL
jgi:hypothetical protein